MRSRLLSPARSPAPGVGVLLVLAVAALVVGWNVFWFLTDDAFIAFRYISNRALGFGYVWNAPPFLPVEGYTSFLWVLLLDGVWQVTGIDPPGSANAISLLCAIGTLLVTARMVWTLPLSEAVARHRLLLLGLVLLGLVSNRTFLTWTSSGLETALFNLLIALWVYAFVRPGPELSAGRSFGAVGAGALLALTRPEGWLFLAGGFAVALPDLARALADPARGVLRRTWVLLPSALPVMHLLWRRWTYGEWVPNTYYAKQVGAWPESGARYLGSFVLEYAVWVWALAGVVALALWWRGRSRSAPQPDERPARWRRFILLSVLLFNAGYYTFAVGGDHFEFRIYSHLVPLLLVSLVWMLDAVKLRPATICAVLFTYLALGWPVPWIHWNLTRGLQTRQQTMALTVPVAPHLPAPVRWYGRLFDDAQAWLIRHSVGRRHQEHKVFWLYQMGRYKSRAQGMRMTPAHVPVLHYSSVGIIGWLLPRVYVIDRWGLNDYVIARTPVPPDKPRLMAHDRWAPPGYLEDFPPNVRRLHGGRMAVYPREEPLTLEELARREQKWRAYAQER